MKENIKHWLKEGKQSKITPKIKKIAQEFKGDEIDKIIKILNWIEKNIKHNYAKATKIFATRTSEQIIKDKYHTGCHDTAVLLATFLRAVNIPARYLTGINRLNPKNNGHCVVEAFVKNKWILIEDSKHQINFQPTRSDFYYHNYIIARGLDSWDNGIKSFKDWEKVSEKVIKKIKEIEWQ